MKVKFTGGDSEEVEIETLQDFADAIRSDCNFENELSDAEAGRFTDDDLNRVFNVISDEGRPPAGTAMLLASYVGEMGSFYYIEPTSDDGFKVTRADVSYDCVEPVGSDLSGLPFIID